MFALLLKHVWPLMSTGFSQHHVKQCFSVCFYSFPVIIHSTFQSIRLVFFHLIRKWNSQNFLHSSMRKHETWNRPFAICRLKQDLTFVLFFILLWHSIPIHFKYNINGFINIWSLNFRNSSATLLSIKLSKLQQSKLSFMIENDGVRRCSTRLNAV